MGDWFEDCLAPRARYELITLAVWVPALALAVMAVRHWQQAHQFDIQTALPIFHVMPWLTAQVLKRKWFKVAPASEGAVAVEDLGTQSTLRVLWTAYATLAIAEFGLY